MARYDIIMPTFGKPEATEKCVRSIVGHSHDFRLIWIDNNPDQSGAETIAGKYNLWSRHEGTNPLQPRRFEYLPMPEHLGFVKAINVGLALSTAPFVVLLHNDTEVPADWLQKLERGFEKFPRAGVVGPLADSSEGWQCQQYVKARNRYIEIKHRTGLVGPMLCFFCAMISREAIERVGYLSEEFSPGFGADDDWCFRARAAGFSLVLATNMVVKHVHRATWEPGRVNKLQARNTEILLGKYAKQ